MANNSPYNAYLSRTQIYRALFSNYSKTEEKLIFQPRDGQDQRTVSPEILEMEIDLLLELSEDRGIDYNEVSTWKYQFLGTNQIAAQMYVAGANIGERGPTDPQRTAWWDILSGVKALLDLLATSAAATMDNPPSFQVETLTDAETGDETGAVASVSAGVERPTLLVETQNILNRFRSVVYAPNSQETDIRRRYFDAAYASTPARSRAIQMNNIYINNRTEFISLRRWGATRPQPDLFTFNNPDDNYTKQAQFVGTRLIVRLVALHNALFGSNLLPFSLNIKIQVVGLLAAEKMLANCQAGLQILLTDIQASIENASEQADAVQEAQEEVIASNLEETGFSVGYMDTNKINIIANNESYREYFSTTFNQDLITAVPMIHNLYLTTKYFPEVENVFLGPKNTALDLLMYTITGDDEFPTEPDLSRPASAAAIANANGMSPDDFGLNAGKFILKMLIQTPISILKGLVELIDPHVMITKLIKTGSAHGFQKASKILDEPAKVINDRLKEELELESNLSGKNLMTLILCLADYGFEQGDAAISQILTDGNVDLPGNFFPDVSMKGIDFAGTVSGMLMIPPSPLGLLYLLLELVKSEIDGITVNVDDAAAENAEDNEC